MVGVHCRVFHLRTTILPAEEDMPAIMTSFKKFNDTFMDQYDGYSRMWNENKMSTTPGEERESASAWLIEQL